MNYLCTGRLPDGGTRPRRTTTASSSSCSATIQLVPPDQVELPRRAVLTFLDASSYDSIEPARVGRAVRSASRERRGRAEPAHGLMQLVIDRNVAALGPKLLPYIEELGGAAALSPDRSPATSAPVFLLHGADDNIIPSSETPLLAEYLAPAGNPHVQWLLTPLLSHADIKSRTPLGGDAWRLIRFGTEMLDERPTGRSLPSAAAPPEAQRSGRAPGGLRRLLLRRPFDRAPKSGQANHVRPASSRHDAVAWTSVGQFAPT